ncbi:MAG: nucleotidyltransferase family protein [Bacilli bacterium]|nr:nucleotidyltransferase family protein [Bacilli bacterium]
MKCIILAAGYATRLYPLTKNFPKPLLEVNKKPILDYLIEDLESTEEIDEYIIVTNNKFNKDFMEWKMKHEISNKLLILNDTTDSNETRLGAVKDMYLAISLKDIKDDTLIMAGDNLLDFSLQGFINYFKEKNSSCIMRYQELNKERIKKSAEVVIDQDDFVVEMNEKPQNPKSNWASPPFYIIKKDDIKKVEESINAGCNTDAPGSFINYLHKNSKVYAYEMPGKRYDIGDIKSYEDVILNYPGVVKEKEKTR